MALLKINGADMPAPSSLSVRIDNVPQSLRRTLDGTACVSRAAVRRTLTCLWSYLSAENLAALLNAVSAQAQFSLSYPDPATGSARQMTACCTDRSIGLSRVSNGVPVWTQVRLTLTEV